MFQWVPYAMVRIALVFMAGLLLGIYRTQFLTEYVAWALAIGLTGSYFLVALFLPVAHRKWVAGTVGLAAVFVAGYLNVLVATDARYANHLLHVKSAIDYYEVVIDNFPQEKEKSWKLEAKLIRVRTNDEWQPVQAKVLLYFPKKDFASPFVYGDRLLVKGAPQQLTPPANPGEFDYQRFLTFRKTYHQHFVQPSAVRWVAHDPPNEWVGQSILIRSWADAQLRQVVKGDREQAIASALVLGVTDGLDNELIQAYSATGALHVLAVSGLHVGIIYWIILLLLKPLTKSEGGRWTVALLSIFILWVYAFVTGLSPSVLRAVTMFSFVALAKPWRQGTNIYNTLAASAFCLLLYEPYLIMSVGFQLSFIAVLGIVYLQPLFYRWWEPENRIWDEIWKISCVSLAAQLATFALGLLYFHQFPNYFLFSNLFVIPLSFVVLVAGLVVVAFSFLAPVAAIAGFVLIWTIKAMNLIVFAVEALPYSLLENIYITTWQCWCLMLFAMALILLFTTRKAFYIYALVLTSSAFSWEEWQWTRHETQRAKFTVYKVAGHTAIDFFDRGSVNFLTDSALAANAERIRFHIQPNRLRMGARFITSDSGLVRSKKGTSLMRWKGQTFLVLNEKNTRLPESISVDWILIRNNSVMSLQEIKSKVAFKNIIIDSSNSFHTAGRLLKESGTLNVQAFSVLHNGAFEYWL